MNQNLQIHSSSGSFRKKMLFLTGLDVGVFVLFLFVLLLLFSIFFLKQLPNSPNYNELDPWSIAMGTGVILITLKTSAILSIIFFVIHMILSVVIYHRCFLRTMPLKLNVHAGKTRSIAELKRIGCYIIIYIGSMVPFIYAFYLVKKGFFNAEFRQFKKNYLFKFKLFLYFISFGMIILSYMNFVGIPITVGLLISLKPYYNKENVQKFYKLSNNHDNLLYLYFDRTDGWKIEEQIKKLDDHHQKAFEDFTFYKNTLSLADTTFPALPYLLFGYNANINQKQQLAFPLKAMEVTSLDKKHAPIIFPGSNHRNVSQLSTEEFYRLALANFVSFGNYLGYGITNICNLPYYGKESPFIYMNHNSYQTNYDMQNLYGFKNFSATYSNEEAKYNGWKVHYNHVDDAAILGNMKNDFKFVDTNTSVFTALYSGQNHWDFGVKDGKGGYCLLRGNSYEHHLRAIQDSLIDTSELLLWLKDYSNSRIGKNMTVIITSDHGHCFASGSRSPEDKSSPDGVAGFAPVFMVSTPSGRSKLIHLKKAAENFLHYDQSLITTADQLAIIRNLLYPNGTPTLKDHDPLDPSQRYSVHTEEGNLLNCYMSNPKGSESGNRKFEVISPLDWRYLYGRKSIEYARIRHFKGNRNPDLQSIFHPENWTDILN